MQASVCSKLLQEAPDVSLHKLLLCSSWVADPVLGTAGSAYVLLTLGACTTAGGTDATCAVCGATEDCARTAPDSLVGTDTFRVMFR